MATHDYVLDNATGANFRSDLNNALAAIVSNNSSSTEPSTKYAYQWWADTNEGVLKIRNSANDGWVTLLQLDGTLTLEDGSNSAPALGFRDDLDTGIFSSAANNLDITTGGTTRVNVSSTGINVTGTVVDDGATHDGDVTFTGASANVVFNKSDNRFEFADNAKAEFGTGSDMEIFHNGTNSIIENLTGELRIQGDLVRIMNGAGNKVAIETNVDNNVELYFNNAKKAETVTGGFTVTGTCTATAFAGDGSALTGITSTTINNNVDNRVITGSGTANTLNAESTLTYDASLLNITSTTQGLGLRLTNTGNEYTEVRFDAARTGAGSALGILTGRWNNSHDVAQIYLQSGDDTTNKDDGRISFNTQSASGSSGTRLRIEPDGKIGIGTTSPDQTLHIHKGSAGTVDSTSQTVLTLENSAAAHLQFLTPNNNANQINFGDPQDNTKGYINYNHNGDALSFGTGGGNEAMRIDSSQRVLVATNSSNSISSKLISKVVAGTSVTWAQCGLAVTNASAINRKSLIGFGFSGNGGTNPPAAIGGITTDTASFEHNDLAFYTRNVTTDTEPSERMRVTSAGAVLVGRTSTIDTSEAFGIKGPSGDHATLGITTDGTTNLGIISFNDNDANFRGSIRYSHSQDSLSFRTAGSEVMLLDSGGVLRLGDINGTSLGGKLQIADGSGTDADTLLSLLHVGTGDGNGIEYKHNRAGSGGTAFYVSFRNSSSTQIGAITSTGSSITYGTGSDYRLKENVVSLTGAITRIKQLLPKRFNFIEDTTNTLQDGFLAHEVSPIVPEAITGTKDETKDVLYEKGDEIPEGKNIGDVKETVPKYQSIDQAKLVPLLVAAVQELITKVETLEAA